MSYISVRLEQERKHAKGWKQKRCKVCKLFYFKDEKKQHLHKFPTVKPRQVG